MSELQEFVNKIICGECVQVMKKFPDNSVDLIITSPPYYEKNIRGHNNKSSPLYKKFFPAFITYKDKWFEQIYRIIKETGMIFINLGFNATTGWQLPFNLIENNLFNTRDLIIWEKKNPEPNSNGGLTHSFEFIFVLHKNKTPIYSIKKGEYIKDVWQMKVEQNFSCTKSSKFYHGAMFPQDLPKRCLQIAGGGKGIVLDPFLGSGTTAIACKELGYDYIGIDINPDYCQLAERRLMNTITNFL